MLKMNSLIALTTAVCISVPLLGFAAAKPVKGQSTDAMGGEESGTILYANNSGKAGKDGLGSKTALSVDECIQLTLKNNTRIKIKEEEYKKAKIERDEAKRLSDKIDRARDNMKKVPMYYLDRMDPGKRIRFERAEMQTFAFEGAQGKDVAPKLKEAEELVSQKTLELEKQDLSVDVETIYYKALLAEDNLKNAKVQLERSKEQLKNAQVSYDNGVIAKDAVLLAQAGLASSEQNVFSAQKNVEMAKMSLNKLMSRDLKSELTLTTRFVYKPEELGDVKDMVESALKLRPEVINIRAMKDVTALNADLSLKYYAENTYIYRKAKNDAKRAEFGVKEAEDSINLAVNAAYLNAEDASEKLKSAEKVKAAAEEAYRIMDLKYKSQVITTAELLESHENLNKAELFYTSSVFDYNIAKAELKNWAGKGLE